MCMMESVLSDEPKLSVGLFDASPFGRRALSALLRADPSLEVDVASVEGMREHVLHRDPDVIVVRPSASGEVCPLIDEAFSAGRKPLGIILPPDASPDRRLDALEAGAALTIPWSMEAEPAAICAFQSLLLARVKLLGLSGARSHRPASSAGARLTRDGRPSNPASEETLTLNAPDPAARADGLAHPPPSRDPALAANPMSKGSGDVVSRSRIEPRPEVIVMGGGVGTLPHLREILAGLPEAHSAAFLVVLRIEPSLFESCVARLRALCPLPLRCAEEGDPLRAGRVLVAPPSRNLGLVRTGRIPRALVRLLEPDASPSPSLDVTLQAVSRIYAERVAGVVLGGQGGDGGLGFRAVRDGGGLTVALDPDAVAASDTILTLLHSRLVDKILSPSDALKLMIHLNDA